MGAFVFMFMCACVRVHVRRRALHERLCELRGNIRVMVRVRPFLERHDAEVPAAGARGIRRGVRERQRRRNEVGGGSLGWRPWWHVSFPSHP